MTFEAYGLSENPFISASPDFPLIDRTTAMAHLGEVSVRFIEASSPAIIAVLGAYGLGKTALLQELQRLNRAGGFIKGVAPKLRVAYMKALPPDATTKYSLYLYRSLVSGLGYETFSDWRKAAQALSGPEAFGVPRALKAAGADMAQAIHALGPASRPGDAWDYLQGGKLSASQIKDLRVSAGVDTNEEAQAKVVDVLRLSKAIGEGGVMLLIDEWEYLFTAATTAKAVQVHTAVKELYDRVREAIEKGERLAALLIVIACTPLAWQTVSPRTSEVKSPAGLVPFAERVADEYSLDTLSLSDTENLVASRLEARRLAPQKQRLHPFTQGALKAVYERAAGSPRDTLGCCAFLLEQAALSDKGSIDAAFAQELLQAYQFPMSGVAGETNPA